MRAPFRMAAVVTSWLAGALLGCGAGTLTDSASQGAQKRNSSLTASTRPGMGAIPYDTGTTFRVWAPSAYKVLIAGDFNGWLPTEIGNEFNGNFSFDYEGAKAGQQYQYQIQSNLQTFWRTDPRAQECVNSIGNSIIHDRNNFQWWHDADFTFPARNEQVVYEMHIGTYDDSPGFGPGTFQSAIAKLSHLNDLGVNVVELMPVSEFSGDFNWGYGPAVLFSPEVAYGKPNDMKQFVDEAHKRGIAVVLDVVYNHWGPSDLGNSLWNFDVKDGNGGIYFYQDGRQATAWGPRPDFGRQEVRDFIADNASQWLNEYHVDGLRLDSTVNIRATDQGDNPDGWRVLKQVTDAVHQGPAPKIAIAEDNGDDADLTDPSGANFDAQWDLPFVHAIDGVITAGQDRDRDLGQVVNAITHRYQGNGLHRVIFTESHDEVANGKQRLPSQIGGWDSGGYFAKKLSTLGVAIALTAPGTPMILQGQEFLTPGTFVDSVPLDWSFASTYAGIQQLYTDLIHARRNWNNTTGGLRGDHVNVFHRNDSGKVLAYHRWDSGGPGDDVVVVANFSNTIYSSYAVGFPHGGSWKVRFNSDWKGYSSDFAGTNTFDLNADGGGMDGLGQSGSFALGPYSILIFSQDR